MNNRPRRAALHQRSDSETNEVRTNPSIHSSNSSVSQKASDVSAWVPHPVVASISRDSTRSSSRTASTNSSRGPSGSIDSLPPVPPLKIYKRESTFIVPRDPPTIGTRGSQNPDIPASASIPAPNTTPPKGQTFPKSILKKPSRPALPPYTVEEYNEKSNSWIANSSQSPTSSEGSKMNSYTLRIVGSSEDSNDEGSEEGDIVGGLVNRQHSVSISPRVLPSPRLGESSAQGARMFPSQPAPTRSRSNASIERPGTAGSLLASAKQLPAWARYFYSKRGGRGSIIEPELPRHGNEDPTERKVRHQQSDDSMQITEVIPPGALYQGQGQWGSSESVPGVDWVGSRTKIMDAEIATQWSTPHLDHTPLSRFETIDRQLVMFCLGFLLPVCWIIAAFLPLPEVQARSYKQPISVVGQPSHYAVDAEVGSNNTAKQQRKYENAKWWRSVNRTMSVVGLLVIGAIIALCVLAATRGV